ETRHARHLAGELRVIDGDARTLAAVRLDHDRMPDTAAFRAASRARGPVRTLDRCEGDAMALESAPLRQQRGGEHDDDEGRRQAVTARRNQADRVQGSIEVLSVGANPVFKPTFAAGSPVRARVS